MHKMGFLDSLKKGLQRSREAHQRDLLYGRRGRRGVLGGPRGHARHGRHGRRASAMRVVPTTCASRRPARTSHRAEQLRDALARAPSCRVFPRPGATRSRTSPSSSCCSWASTAPARPPRWASSPDAQDDAGRPVPHRRGRHLPRRRHRAARGVGRARRAWTWSPASAGPTRRACATTWWSEAERTRCRARAHRHRRAPAHLRRPHARAGQGRERHAQALRGCPCTVVLVIDATTGQNGLQPGARVQRGARARRPHRHQARRHRQGRHRACHFQPAGPPHLPDWRGGVHRRPPGLRRARLLPRARGVEGM